MSACFCASIAWNEFNFGQRASRSEEGAANIRRQHRDHNHVVLDQCFGERLSSKSVPALRLLADGGCLRRFGEVVLIVEIGAEARYVGAVREATGPATDTWSEQPLATLVSPSLLPPTAEGSTYSPP